MIYVVIPLQQRAPDLVTALDKIKKALAEPYRLILVLDGDAAAAAVPQEVWTDDRMLRCQTRVALGMGAVLLSGLLKALKDSDDEDQDIVVTYEIGQAGNTDLLLRLVETVRKGADMALASRHAPGGGYRHFPLPRLFFSRTVHSLMTKRCPIAGVRDYTIFLRAYRLSLIRQAVKHFGPYGLIQARGFVANTELLVKLSTWADRVREVPVQYDLRTNRSREQIKILDTINEYLVIMNYLERLKKKLNHYQGRQERRSRT